MNKRKRKYLKYEIGGELASSLGGSNLTSSVPGLMASYILDAINGQKERRNYQKARGLQTKLATQFSEQADELNDASLLNMFPSEGVNSISNYAAGGTLLPVNDKVELAVGDSHEKDTNNDGLTGITLSLQGKPMAEIENGEVKWDNKIFSDRNGIGNKSFAKMALELIKTPEYKKASEMEDKYGETVENVRSNIFKRGTGRRMLQKNPNPLESLFQIQESMKQEEQSTESVPKGQSGLDLDKILNKAGNISANLVPYLDNIYNANLIANAPQLPTPTKRVAPILKTDYDINPQLNEINRDTEALNKIITDTTASSSIANTNRIANRLQGTYAKNRALSEKQNIETGLKNQQASINADITNQNSGLLDEYRLREFGRQSDLRREKSANVANAVEDATMQQTDKNAAKLDKQKIALVAAQYLDSGVLDRSGFDKVMDIIDKGGSIEDAMQFMQSQRKRADLKPPEKLPQRKQLPIKSRGSDYYNRNRLENYMNNLID